MTEIYINNNFDILNTCDTSKVTSFTINTPNNIQLILNNLCKLTNLQNLHLNCNEIKEIIGLDSLVKLQK